MPERITAWGVGPRLALAAFPYFGLMLALRIAFPRAWLMSARPHPLFVAIGSVLVAVGVVMWAGGARVIDRAFHSGRLLTAGVYSVVRHPMYSGFIVLIVPGVSIMLRSWLLLTAAPFAYVVFRLLIRREDRYLQEKFGQEYSEYRARVHAIIPVPRPRPHGESRRHAE